MVIERSLVFLESQLNSYLKIKLGEEGETETKKKVELTALIKQNGDLLIGENTVGLSLVNIEEERVGKSQTPYSQTADGRQVQLNPEIKINLFLLFTAHFKTYTEALKALSLVMGFFQGRNVFERTTYPKLDPSIEKLIFELHTLTFEQMNHLWGALGAKYLPSVLYKMRMLVISEEEILEELLPIREFNIQT